MPTEKQTSVEAYLHSFPSEQQSLLNQLRTLIKHTIPEAEEKMAWGAPTYYLEGYYFVQFSAAQRHLGFYTSPAVLAQFQDELKPYQTNSKNTLKLSWNSPLPEDLLMRMLQFRAEEVRKRK